MNEGGPRSSWQVPYKRQKRRDTDTEEKPREDESRDGRKAAEGLGAPGPPEAGKDMKNLIREPPEGLQPCNNLISSVWSPGLGEDEFLLF